MSQAPTTDDEAVATIRSLGHRPEVTATMEMLFGVQRKQGVPLLGAFKVTLLHSLPDATLRRMEGNEDCLRVLAERAKMGR